MLGGDRLVGTVPTEPRARCRWGLLAQVLEEQGHDTITCRVTVAQDPISNSSAALWCSGTGSPCPMLLRSFTMRLHHRSTASQIDLVAVLLLVEPIQRRRTREEGILHGRGGVVARTEDLPHQCAMGPNHAEEAPQNVGAAQVSVSEGHAVIDQLFAVGIRLHPPLLVDVDELACRTARLGQGRVAVVDVLERHDPVGRDGDRRQQVERVVQSRVQLHRRSELEPRCDGLAQLGAAHVDGEAGR